MSVNSKRTQNNAAEEALKQNIRDLRFEIRKLRKERTPKETAWTPRRPMRTPSDLTMQKTMVVANHGDAIDVDYGRKNHVLSLSSGAKAQGTIVAWDASTGVATHYVSLIDPWNLFAAFEKSAGNLIGVGGLNNDFYVYELPNDEKYHVDNPKCTLRGHDQVINRGVFADARKAITASSDRFVKCWDVNSQMCVREFEGHTGDIFCCAAHPSQSEVCLTGAGDFTARIWDGRVTSRRDDNSVGLVGTYDTHSRDVNDVDFFPDGYSFATGLSNTQVHIYDIRASCQIASFAHPQVFQQSQGSCERVSFSPSGRLLFAMYKNGRVFVYDVAGPYEKNTKTDAPFGHCICEVKTAKRELFSSISVDKRGGSLAGAIKQDESDKNNTILKVYWPSK